LPGEGSIAYPKSAQLGASRVQRKLARKAENEQRWREVCQEIDRRDNHTCRICGHYSSPMAIGLLDRSHRHHMNATDRRARVHESRSILTLCAKHHDEVENSGKLRVEGDANLRGAESGKLCGVKVSRLTEFGWQVEKWC
jgi:hypothetical protein